MGTAWEWGPGGMLMRDSTRLEGPGPAVAAVAAVVAVVVVAVRWECKLTGGVLLKQHAGGTALMKHRRTSLGVMEEISSVLSVPWDRCWGGHYYNQT